MKKQAEDIFDPDIPVVPQGWDILPFEQAVDVISDKSKRVKQSSYLPSGKLPVIDQGQDFIGGYTDDEGMAFEGELPVILFGDHTRSIKYVDRSFVVGAEGVKILKPSGRFDPKYLYYLLRSLQIPSRGYSRHFQFLRKFHFPRAPENQQKRIVAEIEKQFSRLDEAVANLKRVKANLKRYKAAVLKAAVEGRLVETEAELARRDGRSLPTPRPGVFYVYAIRCDDDSIYIGHTDDLARRWEEHLAGQGADWTKQHKPIQIVHYEEYSSRQEAADREKWLKTGYGRKWIKREIEAGRARQVGYETGAQLLQRILETRRSQWLARADKAGGKGKGKYKEPAAPDTTDLPELPEGWVWANFGLAAERVTVGHVGSMKDEYVEDGTPFLRSQNVRPNRYDPEGLKFISEKFHHQLGKSTLKPGDIVVVRSGSVGVSCVIPEQLTEANCSDLVIVKVPRAVLPDFGAYYMNSVVETRVAAGKVGVALTHFNTQSVAELPLPVPPLAEQHRIVAETDRRLSLVREVEMQVDANLMRAERLRQSILSRAFAGQLLAEYAKDQSEHSLARPDELRYYHQGL